MSWQDVAVVAIVVAGAVALLSLVVAVVVLWAVSKEEDY